MFGCARVLAGVLARRVVAATRATALLAHTQVDPLPADLYAVFAFLSLWMLNVDDSPNVRTIHFFHGSPLRRKASVDPGLDVSHDNFLVDITEKVVEVALIELQCLIG